MKALRTTVLPNDAFSLLNLEFAIENQENKSSSLFPLLDNLILESQVENNSQDWQSYLFKNLEFLTQINDLEIIMNEFASESYRKSISKILRYSTQKIGLSALINFQNLPEDLMSEHKERLYSEIQDFMRSPSEVKNLYKSTLFSYITPWLDFKSLKIIQTKIEKTDILDIFELDEGAIVFENFDEEDVKKDIHNKFETKLKELADSKRVKKTLKEMEFHSQILWLRDFVFSLFYRDSELNKIKQDAIESSTSQKTFKLSKHSLPSLT